ncbi:DUF6499 domain-containing protein [Ensifer adhaerens]|uniref:transcriptional regulator domain-containing protein n=1 Tax=Ensifer adhaerens TaxID=106592 RepID=UPI001CBAFD9D|nr:DUF6499 domain-containing protein [Ensifer adhaerens]MBZ7921523.1 DUF6499 domain-containing protein [Ensifer adhaerens]UAX93947.1 DUF6499 domain-containing protein [Ensifer adhaerens]UAY01582.1 DUF6499 domain-containing protein [Ensifer adhaerens]UAY08965.1 DUF6499 domain-containing protein [Ensifer adhaerens]
MRPDTSNWRNDSSYDFIDRLPIEGLAWECLRRYVPYQDEYISLLTDKAENQPLRPEKQQRWGLRFPRKPSSIRLGATGGVVAIGRSQHTFVGASPALPPGNLASDHWQLHRRA